MTVEATGPMGYWENESDDIHKTIARDMRGFEAMQNIAPERFEARAGSTVYDEELYDLCIKLGQEDAVEEGWDMTWLELLCKILLDRIYKQLIGSCVATAHITLIATRSIHEIVLLGQSEKLLGRKLSGLDSVAPFGPYSYRAGRKMAGINGRGDGSTCSGQIRGTMQYGYLPCDTSELTSHTDFLPEPKSTSKYREWGARDTLMNRFQPHASQFDLVEAPEVKDADKARELIMQFKPMQICSGWGFAATRKKLPNGDTLYTRRGSWAHSMQIQAIVRMTDSNWYVKVRNQWGNAHSGKNYFWITMEEFSRWLRSANTIAIGELQQRDEDTPVDLWAE